jgi:hypothetical protein
VLASGSVRSSNSTVGSAADPSYDGSYRTFLAWQL